MSKGLQIDERLYVNVFEADGDQLKMVEFIDLVNKEHVTICLNRSEIMQLSAFLKQSCFDVLEKSVEE